MPKTPYRIYQRGGRWYLDARKFGGDRIPLTAPGDTLATTDERVAHDLAMPIIAKMRKDRAAAADLGFNPGLALRAYGERFLSEREATGGVSEGWGKIARDYLANALTFFETVQPAEAKGADRRRMTLPRTMASITPPDVRALQQWLRQQPNGRGGTYSEQTVRHHCTVLSRIYRHAVQLDQLQSNPVQKAGLPAVAETDTPLLEAEEVALALEAARLVEDEANQGEGEGMAARRMIRVVLSMLAYTGCRMDEAERAEWGDLLQTGEDYLLRVHSASKGARAGRRRSLRLVPLSPHFVPVLLEWRRRSGRVAGPILAALGTGSMPALHKALRAVERRAGLPEGTLGSRTLRVAYATHRATCAGVTWNDVRDELGHADLRMQGVVYGRGRLNREPMGPDLDYRWERWERAAGQRGASLATSAGTPSRWETGRPERERVVRSFLEAVSGWGVKRAQAETGVDRNVIQRLRAGRSTDVKGAAVAAMREYLERPSRMVG